MTRRSLPVALLLALVLCLAGGLPAQYGTFVKRFDSAMETGDEKNMDKAVDQFVDEAVTHFEILVNSYISSGDGRLVPKIDKLKEVFKRTHNSSMLEKIEHYTSNWDEEDRNLRRVAEGKERQAYGAFQSFKTSKKVEDKAECLRLVDEAIAAYKELGDTWMEARVMIQKCSFLEHLEPESVEQMEKRAELARAYIRMIGEDLDFKTYKPRGQWVNWLKGFENDIEVAKKGGGLPSERKAKDAEAKENAPEVAELTKYKDGSKWTRVDMTISMMKEPMPSICGYGSVYPLDWNAVGIRDEQPKKIDFFQDGEIYIKRDGPSKFFALVDEAGAKAPPERIKFGNSIKPTWIKYLKDDNIYEYAFFLWTGSAAENHLGVQLNLSPSWDSQSKYALMFYRSASILHADIEGTPIELYDDNFNGIVGEDPSQLAFSDGRFGCGFGADRMDGHPAFDAMKIGRGPLQPFSKYVKVDDDWYKLNVLGNNETLNYRPMDPSVIPTGNVTMDFDGPRTAKPDYLVIQGLDFLQGSYFEIAKAGSKGIEVPAGRYRIYYGRMFSGKPPRHKNSVLLPGDSQPFEVKAGELTKVKIGAPFTIQFEVEHVGDRLSVDASRFWVKGAAGEKYGAIGAEILEPELVWSRNQDGKGAHKLGEWREVKSGDEFQQLRNKYSNFFILWLPYYPIAERDDKVIDVKLEVDKPVKSGTFYVGVQQKKHKLFGRLEAVFK